MKKLLLSIACVLLVSLSLLPFATSAVASPKSDTIAKLCVQDGGKVAYEDDNLVVCKFLKINAQEIQNFLNECDERGGKSSFGPAGGLCSF